MSLVRSESITVYLFLVLYRSTSLQSLSFLKNIKTFLCKQKLMNNRSIPSMQQPYNHDSFSKYQDLLQHYSKNRFSKNIKNILCKQKIVNNCSIPSTHAERKITNLSVKHSFTLYLSLSPHEWTESQTEEQIHLLRVGWRNFFPVVLLCQFLVLAGNRFWFYILTYLEYNTVVALCQFFGSGGKQFLVLRTYLVYNTVVHLCQFFGCGGKQISK